MIKGSKICGIKDSDTLNFIINHPHPPKFIGFICNYPKSPRYIDTKELNLTKLRLLVDNLGLLKPTRIYTELLKMYEDEEFYKIIKGAVHITGGGFEDNICRVLPDGYDFFLTRTIMFSDVFRWIQGRGSLQYSDMLKIYNCGIGIVLVIMKNEETKFTVNNLVKKYNLIELGEVVKKTSSPKNL